MRKKKCVLWLVLSCTALVTAGCGRVGGVARRVGEDVGALEVHLECVTNDVVVDGSVGSPATVRRVEATIRMVLPDVVRRPGSVLRLFVLGEEFSSTRSVGSYTSLPPPSPSSSVQLAHEARENSRALSLFDQVGESLFLQRPRRSPLAESIAKIALLESPVGHRRTIIVLTDGLESSGLGEWECGPLPTTAKWLTILHDNHLFRPGSLNGVRLVFAYAAPTSIAGNRCRQGFARWDTVRSLWQAASDSAGASFRMLQEGPGKDDVNLGYFLLLPTWRTARRDRRVRRKARRHARNNTDMTDLVVRAEIGTKPEYNPNDPEQVELQASIPILRTVRDELRDELRTVRKELTKYTWIVWLRLGLIFSYLTEVIGSMLVLRDIGLNPRDRTVLAFALAAITFLITWAAARLGTTTRADGTEHKPWWFPVVIGSYALLMIALVVVRVSAATSGETAWWTEAAMGIVMLFTTIGPAISGELIMHKMRPIAPLVRQRKELQTQEKKTDRELTQAVRKASDAAKAEQAWTEEDAHLRAVYMEAYYEERADIAMNQPAPEYQHPEQSNITPINERPNGTYPEVTR